MIQGVMFRVGLNNNPLSPVTPEIQIRLALPREYHSKVTAMSSFHCLVESSQMALTRVEVRVAGTSF